MSLPLCTCGWHHEGACPPELITHLDEGGTTIWHHREVSEPLDGFYACSFTWDEDGEHHTCPTAATQGVNGAWFCDWHFSAVHARDCGCSRWHRTFTTDVPLGSLDELATAMTVAGHKVSIRTIDVPVELAAAIMPRGDVN